MGGTSQAEGTRALQCVHGGGSCKDALLGCLCWSGRQRVLGVTSPLTCAHVRQVLGAEEDVGLLWVTSAVCSWAWSLGEGQAG